MIDGRVGSGRGHFPRDDRAALFGVDLGRLSDQPISIGAVVENTRAVVTAIAATALAGRVAWGRTAPASAQASSILAVLVAIFATRRGTRELNFLYHRAILVVLVFGLLARLTRPGRSLRLGASD